MKNRLEHEAHSEHSAELQNTARSDTREFHAAEGVLRADKEQIEVPERIAERLAESIANEPHPNAPWWKRLFRKSGSQT